MNKHPDVIDVIMKESSLILDSGLIQKLNAKPGDRIVIGYIQKDGILTPVISVGEDGNKLTNSNTISFRGKQRNNLAQFGSNFWAKEDNGIIELEGDGLPIFTEVKKAVETYITKEIILDTNYNIKKLDNYEF